MDIAKESIDKTPKTVKVTPTTQPRDDKPVFDRTRSGRMLGFDKFCGVEWGRNAQFGYDLRRE